MAVSRYGKASPAGPVQPGRPHEQPLSGCGGRPGGSAVCKEEGIGRKGTGQ